MNSKDKKASPEEAPRIKAIRKKVNCPYCKKITSSLEQGVWPFCSRRCQTADIGNWASESYRISGEDSNSPEIGDGNDIE